MRALILLTLLCLSALAQKPAGKLTQTYDRFENATFVEWRAPLPVPFSDLSTPTLIIRFSCDGKTYRQPSTKEARPGWGR